VAVMMSDSYLGGLSFTNRGPENLFRETSPQIGASYCPAWEKRFLWHFMAFRVWCAIFWQAFSRERRVRVRTALDDIPARPFRTNRT
jgi:hypothetical protein